MQKRSDAVIACSLGDNGEKNSPLLPKQLVVGAAVMGGFFLQSFIGGGQFAQASIVHKNKGEKTAEMLQPGSNWFGDLSAAGQGSGTPMSPEEVDAETRAAIARAGDERMQKQMRRAKHKSKGGKLVKNPDQSRAPDPTSIPSNKEIEKMALQSAWRPDKLKDMTYTQFWNLVGEGHIESVRYTPDRRSVYVKTKASAPGGVRTAKVGLPYDPELFDHLINHGTYIEPSDLNPAPVSYTHLRAHET